MAGVTLTTNGSPWLLSELQALTRPPIASPTDRKALARAVAPPRALGDRGKPARKGASAAARLHIVRLAASRIHNVGAAPAK